MSIALTLNTTLNRIFAISTDAILILNSYGELVGCNGASEKLLGIPRDQLLHKELFSLVAPSSILNQNRLINFAKGKDGDTRTIHELEYRDNKGNTLALQLKLNLMVDGNDRQIIVHIRNAVLECKGEKSFSINSPPLKNNALLKTLKENNIQLKANAKLLENMVEFRTIELSEITQKLIRTNLQLTNQIQMAEAEEKRANSNEALFFAIAHDFPNGIIQVFNDKLEFVHYEGQDLSEFGYQRKDFIGKSIDSITPYSEEKKHRLKEYVLQTLMGKRLSYDTTYGNNIYAMNTTPLRIGKDTIWALFVANNITKQKQIEKELQIALKKIDEHSKELDISLQKLVNSNLLFEQQLLETKAIEAEARKNQRLFAAIADNFPRGIICVINDKWEYEYLDGEIMKQLKIDPKHFIGKNMDEVAGIDKKRHQLFKEDVKRTFAGEHLNFEVKFNHQIFSVNTTPLIEGDGEIRRILFVYNNITHQKNIEKKIRKSLKKEHQLNNLKSQFISTASHEFRTPLSAILSSADLIEAQNNSGHENRRLKHLDKIKSNVQRLVVILDEFLSISQLEAKKVLVKPEYFDLVPFSKYLLRELKPNLKPGQKIQSKFESPEIPVQMDPKLLDHILRNLLVNAIKFSPEGSKIVFKLGHKGKMLFFEISDSGIGISPTDQKQIFQQFFRADDASNIQGTGLGLHLVKQYVELMKGKVSLKSEVDKGTTFYVQLNM